MAARSSSNSGLWSASSTWGGAVPPGNGDTATINATHIVEIDGSVTVGTDPANDTTYVITIVAGGTLKWLDNPTGDWTLTIKGNVSIAKGGVWEVGNAVNFIPATRTATVNFPTGNYTWRVLLLGTMQAYGAPNYHMADATKQRTTVKTAFSSGAGVQVEFNDAVDWSIGDTVWFAVGGDKTVTLFNGTYTGYSDTYGHEKLVIQSKISASIYTFNPTYKHLAGDMAIHGDRNVIFSGVALKGFSFSLSNSDGANNLSLNLNWVRLTYFGRVTANRAAIEVPDSSSNLVKNDTIILKNVLWDTAACRTQPVIYIGLSQWAKVTQTDIDECHVWDTYGFLFMYASSCVWKMGHISMLAMIYYGIAFSGKTDIDCVWYTHALPWAAIAIGIYAEGELHLRSGKIHASLHGINTLISAGQFRPQASSFSLIENVDIFHAAANCVYCLHTFASARFYKITTWDSRYAGLNVGASNPFDLECDECSFQQSNVLNSNLYGGVVLTGYIGKVFNATFRKCTFGTESQNKTVNVNLGNNFYEFQSGRVIFEKCKFKLPVPYSGSVDYSPWNQLLSWMALDPVNQYGSNRFRLAYNTAFSVEYILPEVYDAGDVEVWASTYPGVTHLTVCGGGGEMYNEETTVIDKSFAIKMAPFGSYAEFPGTKRNPLRIPGQNGVPLVVKLSLQKNLSMPLGLRPKLHLIGLGIDTYTEMSDAIGSWEQLTITGTPTANGFVYFWVSGGVNQHRDFNEQGDTAGRLSSWVINGSSYLNTNVTVPYRLFWSLTLATGSYYMKWYRDSAGVTQVAQGSRVGTGTITITAIGGSGLTGSVSLDSLGTYALDPSRYVDCYGDSFYTPRHVGNALVYADGLVIL